MQPAHVPRGKNPTTLRCRRDCIHSSRDYLCTKGTNAEGLAPATAPTPTHPTTNLLRVKLGPETMRREERLSRLGQVASPRQPLQVPTARLRGASHNGKQSNAHRAYSSGTPKTRQVERGSNTQGGLANTQGGSRRAVGATSTGEANERS